MARNSTRARAFDRGAGLAATEQQPCAADPVIFRLAGAPGDPQAAAPQGTNGTVTATEDIFYVFSQSDFGYSDSDGHAFAGVLVTTAATHGLLGTDGSAITAGTFVSASVIAAGQFFFEAGQNANGNNFATFTFQVRDSSGAQDSSPNTITVNVLPVNDVPLYHNFNSNSAMTFNEGQTTTLKLDTQGNGTLEDVDSADFGGGYLKVSVVQGGVASEDKLGIDNTSAVTVSGTAAGSTVSVNGVIIGTIAAGGTGIAQDLIVNLNASATADRVQSLIRALSYFNTAENPTGIGRTVRLSVNDGDGTESGVTDLTVGIMGFNDAPVLSNPTTTHINYLPGSPLTPLWEGVVMTDPDNQPNFIQGNIQMGVGGSSTVIDLIGTRFTRTNFDFITDTTTGLQIGSIFMFRGTVQISGLTNAATAEVVNALIHSFGFRTEGANPILGDFDASLTFFDGSYMFGGGITSNMVHQTITVVNSGPAPIIDLNGAGPGLDAIVLHMEGGTPVGLAMGTPALLGAGGGSAIDTMTLSLFNPQPTDVLTWDALPAGVTVATQDINFRRVITFSGNSTAASYQALLASVRYATTSDTPLPQRSVEVSVGSSGTTSAVARTDIFIQETDDLGVARDDLFKIGSADPFFGNVGFDNGYGSDQDPDGFNLIAVNGSAGNVGQVLTFASGATLFVSSGGGITFQANNAYPAGSIGIETFTYTLLGGTSATATILIGAANGIVGTSGADNLTGTASADLILGLAGDDVLNGLGGADRLEGGSGNDTYMVDNAAEVIVELANQGYDTAYTSVGYALGANVSVEVLSTDNWGGTAPIALTGNGFANTLFGNAGNNVLDGGGGADVLNGFGGDDVYLVDNAGDAVVEAAGGGYDTVFTFGTYVLGEGVLAEVLSTIDWTSTVALNLTGNTLANRIYGNAGANVLTGGGGDDVLWGVGGGDTLIGGAGEDVYWIFALDDAITETGGNGYDTAYLFTSYTLGADANVEVVSTFNWLGTEAIGLTGNGLGNTVFGNAGANMLNGGGGADLLVGFGGADTFAFTTALGAGNVDTVSDFVAGTDKIGLDDAIFTQIGALGALNANAFVTGAAAGDADDRIIYNNMTGQLFYDADGNGTGAAVLFATLAGNPTLSASDFIVI